MVAAYVYSRLLKYKVGQGAPADGAVESDAIEKWEQPDDLTVNLHLRQGMKWDQRAPTSGRALTTEDLTMSWDDFAAKSAYRTDLAHSTSDDASVTSFTVTDASTIQIKALFPDAYLLPVLAFPFDFWIMPKESLSGGFDANKDARGSGPWTLDSYQPSVGFKFSKNPNWYAAPDLPYMDAIDMPIIQSAAQFEAQFKSKNVWTSITGAGVVAAPDIVSFHKDLGGARIDLFSPDSSGATVSFSWLPNSPFRDVRVRRAMNMLIDRDAFQDTFFNVPDFQSAGVKMNRYWNTPVGAGYGPFWLDPKGKDFGDSAQYYKLNVAQAKQLLSAAGIQDGFSFPLTTLSGNEYGTDWGQKAEAFVSMFNKGGLKPTVNAIDYTTVWIPKYLRTQGQWEGVAMYPNGSRADVGQWLSVFFTSGGANNQVSKMFPDLDKMISDQRQMLDRQKRINAVHDIQRYMADNAVTIPQGGSPDLASLNWAGLHGPDQLRPWPGASGSASAGTELVASFWIDSSLRS